MSDLLDPPANFIDDFTSSYDKPPEPPVEDYDGGDDWWNEPPDQMFLDRFLYYGSWFLLSYNGFFATVGGTLWVFAL